MQGQLSRIFEHIGKFRENLTKKIEHLRSSHPVITDIMKLNHMQQSIIAVQNADYKGQIAKIDETIAELKKESGTEDSQPRSDAEDENSTKINELQEEREKLRRKMAKMPDTDKMSITVANYREHMKFLEVDAELGVLISKTQPVIACTQLNGIFGKVESRLEEWVPDYEEMRYKRPTSEVPGDQNPPELTDAQWDDLEAKKYRRLDITVSETDSRLTHESIEEIIINGTEDVIWSELDNYNMHRTARIVNRIVTNWLQKNPNWTKGDHFDIMTIHELIQAMFNRKHKSLKNLGQTLAKVVKKLMVLFDVYLPRSRKKLTDGTVQVNWWYYNGHTIESGGEEGEPDEIKEQNKEDDAKEPEPEITLEPWPEDDITLIPQMAENTTIFNSPILSAKILTTVLITNLQKGYDYIKKFLPYILLLSILLLFIVQIDGAHQTYLRSIKDFATFVTWWVGLGVLSSVGLGTGLHTFMLYLGPFIASVTMVAYECHSIPEMLPSRWQFETFGECPDPKPESVSMWSIVLAVQLESFLWGFGTAMGELPPYFIARAARQQNRKADELSEIESENSHWAMKKLKSFIKSAIVQNGFCTVLMCASIPNPLFDLAGLLCGHFGISFWTFFGAVVMGKAVIKAHIQMLGTIFLFSEHHIERLLSKVEENMPFMSNTLSEALKKQKTNLHTPGVASDKTWLGTIWEFFIILMFLIFMISILNSIVRNYLEDEQQPKKTEYGLLPLTNLGQKERNN